MVSVPIGRSPDLRIDRKRDRQGVLRDCFECDAGAMPGSKYPVPPWRPRMTVESPATAQNPSTYGFNAKPLPPHILLSSYPTFRSILCSVVKACCGEFHGTVGGGE